MKGQSSITQHLRSLLREMADRFTSQGYSLKKQTELLNDKTII